jgi:hypothetical protein
VVGVKRHAVRLACAPWATAVSFLHIGPFPAWPVSPEPTVPVHSSSSVVTACWYRVWALLALGAEEISGAHLARCRFQYPKGVWLLAD